MGDELPRHRPGRREAQPEDNVIQPPLQQLQQGLPRDSLGALRQPEVAPELGLQDPVDPLDLLLLTQLQAIALDLRAPPPVLAGRVLPLLDRALVLEAAVPLQEELHSFPPAQPADRIRMSSQFTTSAGRRRSTRHRP